MHTSCCASCVSTVSMSLPTEEASVEAMVASAPATHSHSPSNMSWRPCSSSSRLARASLLAPGVKNESQWWWMSYSDDGGHAAQCKKLKYREKEARALQNRVLAKSVSTCPLILHVLLMPHKYIRTVVAISIGWVIGRQVNIFWFHWFQVH